MGDCEANSALRTPHSALDKRSFTMAKYDVKSLKAEELYRNNYRSEREFRERVQKYIDFYNDKRPHQINRYRTPNATEEAYYKRHADDISETI